MDFHGCSYGFARVVFNGFTRVKTVFPWFSYVSLMVFLWFSYVIPILVTGDFGSVERCKLVGYHVWLKQWRTSTRLANQNAFDVQATHKNIWAIYNDRTARWSPEKGPYNLQVFVSPFLSLGHRCPRFMTYHFYHLITKDPLDFKRNSNSLTAVV